MVPVESLKSEVQLTTPNCTTIYPTTYCRELTSQQIVSRMILLYWIIYFYTNLIANLHLIPDNSFNIPYLSLSFLSPFLSFAFLLRLCWDIQRTFSLFFSSLLRVCWDIQRTAFFTVRWDIQSIFSSFLLPFTDSFYRFVKKLSVYIINN